MLSLDFICQHPQVVQEALRRRRDMRKFDDIVRLAEQRRGLITRKDGLYAGLKGLKETLRTAQDEKRQALNAQTKATMIDIRKLELQVSDVDTHLRLLLLDFPNLPHESVQDCDADREVQVWGEPITYYFEPRAHWELGEQLGIIDAESGARIAGSRFVTLKGAGARLERALISFMLDVHTREHGYTEILPPFLARRSVMTGAGQLPKFEEQAYACSDDELYLNPTAEVPLVGMHSSSILLGDNLPIRYASWTTAFRREAGSVSHHTRGLIRLHQFNKVELFQIVTPQDSYYALEQMRSHAEAILRYLDLPYRVVELCAKNLPFSAAKTFDIEVWMPSQQEYVEIASISNCEAFQARRANIKYRPANGARTEYVHTLNASGLAVGRTMAALLEVYQQADGTVVIPKVLRPFMGTSLLTAASQ
ncbi:serine--tRNA ligase [Ktedonosporobacter rubrisoli]|uniref:Serine--tRNA ligase n=1 Tax=Ktedonosporobacter rubrisoli TaxID=2509675 RepID=A0A4P6K7F1_KTERU|nr:serine--tRNA ligase [Ktedonosporobacter rubrisoli]